MKLIYTLCILLQGFTTISLTENVIAFLSADDNFRAAFATSCVIAQLIITYVSLDVYARKGETK